MHLARLNHTVTLVSRRMEHALELSTRHENETYLPGNPLDASIQIGWQLKPVLMEADAVFLACPSKGLRGLCEQVKENLKSAKELKLFVTLCKGLEEDTHLMPVEVIADVLPGYRHGVLSGPTFADEVAMGHPTAMVFAVDEEDAFTLKVQREISNEGLRVYTSTDLAGVQLGSCLKNVYAIAAGIGDGLKLGDNARATLITRALAEMVRLGTKLGGRPETFYGLSGCGDLILTCHGRQSRNRTFGQLLAEGQTVEHLLNERKMTVEGYRTAHNMQQLCREHGLDAPILDQVHAILYEGKPIKQTLKDLMTRELKSEA